MVKKVVIYYFSGTGNTELVAELYLKELDDAGAEAKMVAIEDVLKGDVAADPGKYDVVGVGYCIHGFNAPRIVYDFIRILPDGGGKRTFIFKCPGDPWMEGGSTSMIRSKLKGRGYVVFHETLIATPVNVGFRIDDGLVKRLYGIAERRVKDSCAEVLAGSTRLQKNTFMQNILTSLSFWETLGARLCGRLFKADKTCTGCGTCERICPTGNIRISGKRPRFGWKCIICLRCIYRCPAGAINPAGFRPALIKKWRSSRDILNDPTASREVPKYHPLLTPTFKRYVEKKGSV